MVKITVVGAGSINFTCRLMVDLFLTPSLFGSTVSLMDIDKKRLDMMHGMVTRYAKEMKASLKIEKTLKREEALEGADFVIDTVKVGGYEPMEAERRIAEKNGYYRGLGDKVSDYYGGLGAYHQLNFVLGLARDMEETCPDAWLLHAGNPVFESTTIASRETKIRAVGICHGHSSYLDMVDTVGLPRKEVEVTVAGVNHNIWLSRFLHNGKNAYPLLDKWIREKAEGYWKSTKDQIVHPWSSEQMSRAAVDMYKLYGLFPIGDTVRSASPWWYHTDLATKKRYFGPLGGFDSEIGWANYLNGLKETFEKLQGWAGDIAVLKKVYPPRFSGEQHIPLIDAVANNKEVPLQLNIPNNGAISGVSDDVAVEVPTVVKGAGVKKSKIVPEHIGRLPKRLMVHVLLPRILRMEQILQAFLEGDREGLLLTIAEDHRTTTFENAKALLDELLAQKWNSEAAKHYKA